MIIRRLRVRRFRKLVDQDFVCGPGLNVVRGPNDAGKSTLHLAFSAALFPSLPREVKSYGPWGEDHPGEILVEFESDGDTFRLRKDFAGRKIVLESSRETLEVPKLIEARIGELVGMSSVNLFRSTLHIGQWELSALDEGAQREIGSRLSRIVTGGDTDGVRVLSDLEKYIAEQEVGLTRPAKNPGPLKREHDELARLAELRSRLSGEVQDTERAAAERDRLAERCAEEDSQVRTDEALGEANRRLREVDQQCEVLSRRAEELQAGLAQADAASNELAAAVAEVESLEPAPDPAAAEALRAGVVREKLLQEAMDEAEEAARLVIGDRPGRSALASSAPRPAWAVFGLVAAGAAMAVGLTLLLTGHAYWGTATVLGGALLAVIIGFAAWASVTEGRYRERADAAEKTLAARRRDVEDAAETTRAQLMALGATSVADALGRAARAEEARQKRDAAQRVLEGLQRGRDREAITKELSQTLVNLGVARTVREDPELALKRLDPAAYQRLGGEAKQRREGLERMKRDLQRLEGRLAMQSRYSDLAAVEEQIAELEARAARRARQMNALRLARNVLDAAHRETVVSGKAVLEEHAGRYLRELSGGAYERLQVDEQTLAPRVWVGGPKEWADVEAREVGSAGVHQCYLALRLALVDVLYGDRKPPLFLDDPFLAYDADRQASAITCLQAIARDRQIFLFTCRDAYDAAADRLIVLGGGERVPAG